MNSRTSNRSSAHRAKFIRLRLGLYSESGTGVSPVKSRPRCAYHTKLPRYLRLGLALMMVLVALALVAVALLGYRLTAVKAATTYLVNSTADLPDADPADGACATASGVCTLRAAIMQANFVAGPSTITLPAGLYLINRVGSDDDAVVGDFDIKHDVTI